MNTTAKQIGFILLASAVLAGAGNLMNPHRIPWVQDWSHQVESAAASQQIRLISLPMAREQVASGGAVFIDARSEGEYLKGHIPGAVSVPFAQLEDHFPRLIELIASGTSLVVYCSSRTCDDALLLAGEIRSMGGDAALFVDGFDAWIGHGGAAEP